MVFGRKVSGAAMMLDGEVSGAAVMLDGELSGQQLCCTVRYQG